MKNLNLRTSLVIALSTLALFVGCADDGEELSYDEHLSSLAFTGFFFYDAGTQCTVGGKTMHCCPNSTVMIGAKLSQNVFKCAQLATPAGALFADLGTSRQGMHACPLGAVMSGFHASSNILACRFMNPVASNELVDGTTSDTFPMHVCPPSHAMSGIHAGNDRFLCAR
jgi:hypothetical protein